MHIITVAPIKRGIPIDELSYFTMDDVLPGTLVTVPLRGRLTPALVIRSTPAHQMKSEIKHAKFAIKKLETVHARNFFRKEFIEACETTGKYFAASTGAVIHSAFPSALVLSEKAGAKIPTRERPKRFSRRMIFQADETDRYITYKSHIREVFARGASCYFVLPSIQDIEHTYASLEKGIQEYTFILHGGLSKKELEARWTKITSMTHPVLIIGTPLFLSIPRYDIESIILDRESAGAYTLQSRPFLDLRVFAEEFAKAIGSDIIFGDLFLRTETLYRAEQGELEYFMRPKFRLPSTAKQHIIDMRELGEQPAIGRIAIASPELVDLIEDVRKKGTHGFIMSVRRGFAPMTVCGDCGTVVSCERCTAPMVLHKKNGTQKDGEGEFNIFLCHRCGFERDTDRICSHCGGWRLTPLGIGVTQAEDAIRQRFPDARIFRMDKDVVKKHAEAQKVMSEFYQTPGSILIGTEMAIPYLTDPIATVAILSVNSMLTIPDFRMGERVFRLLLLLREKAREHFVIQTRDMDVPLFELATSGNIGEFLRTELDARSQLGYPPFSTLIKFTHEGRKSDGEAMMHEIEKLLGAYHPVTFPSFIARVKGKYRMNALLKIPIGGWPNEELLGLIRALPMEIEVRVNPESVI
ncbi:MAG: Primosomal protein N' [Parcubacteria group bacterium GW2011_GWA2_47_7]|nr:MAG: Primosomal protein N' [Parcubacteria group bacterium GW2011_GWA2_47_7]